MDEKRVPEPTEQFKKQLIDRIKKIRPHLILDPKKQIGGWRFKANDFVYERVVESIKFVREEVEANFAKAEIPVNYELSGIKNGEYDRLIIDMLTVCSVADFQAERNLALN